MSQPQPNRGGAGNNRSATSSSRPPRVANGRDDLESGESAERKQDKLAAVNEKVDVVKQSLKKNLEMAIDRGEKIDEIHNKSNDILDDANKFNDTARNVKRLQYRKYYRMIGIIVVIILVFIAIIIAIYYANKATS